MDIHCKIAAALHIIFGALGLLMLAFITLMLGGAAYFANIDVPYFGVIAGLGAMIIGFFTLFALAQMAAGIAFLRGSRNARVFLIVFSALQLFNFPIGTLAGAYSLWALLRKPAYVELP